MTAEVTAEENNLLLLLRKAKALCYADLEIKYQDGKLMSAILSEKIKFN